MNRLVVRALARRRCVRRRGGGRRRRRNVDGVLRPETGQGRAGAGLRPALESGQDGRSLDPRHDEPEPRRLVHERDTGRGDSEGERNGQRRRRSAQRSGARRLRRTVPRLRPVLGRWRAEHRRLPRLDRRLRARDRLEQGGRAAGARRPRDHPVQHRHQRHRRVVPARPVRHRLDAADGERCALRTNQRRCRRGSSSNRTSACTSTAPTRRGWASGTSHSGSSRRALRTPRGSSSTPRTTSSRRTASSTGRGSPTASPPATTPAAPTSTGTAARTVRRLRACSAPGPALR